MKSSGIRRVGAVAGPVAVGALLLVSCGGSDSTAATQSTIDLSEASTAFVVRPPATTLAPDASVDAVGGIVTTEQTYEVKSGDVPINIAKKFGITVDELVNYNGWGSAKEFPFPGSTIKIPPNAKAAAVVSNDDGDTAVVVAQGDGEGGVESSVVTSTPDDSSPVESIPDAGDNCSEGSYKIADGDYEGKVAKKFDVTVEALRAANATTNGYKAFYPGLEIVIPAKADC